MFTLSKQEIFHGNNDFNFMHKYGKSFVNHALVFLVVSKEKCYNGKVGFAAGKKLGGAVVRNRVKRLIREAYRLHKHSLRNDFGLLIIGRKFLIDAKFADAEKAFLNLCHRAKLFVS